MSVDVSGQRLAQPKCRSSDVSCERGLKWDVARGKGGWPNKVTNINSQRLREGKVISILCTDVNHCSLHLESIGEPQGQRQSR